MVDFLAVFIGSADAHREIGEDGDELSEYEIHKREQSSHSYHADKGDSVHNPIGSTGVFEDALGRVLVPTRIEWRAELVRGRVAGTNKVISGTPSLALLSFVLVIGCITARSSRPGS